jgi:hypothetical protein
MEVVRDRLAFVLLLLDLVFFPVQCSIMAAVAAATAAGFVAGFDTETLAPSN